MRNNLALAEGKIIDSRDMVYATARAKCFVYEVNRRPAQGDGAPKPEEV